jgi:nicotinamide-nucleotide amidase
MVRLRLTGTGSDKDILEQELETFVQAIAQKISEHVVSFYDWPMEKILGELLVTKNLTLGLAESCTGGNIGHKITQIPGSSRYFMGGIVCYNETVKESILNVPSALIEEKGVVSEEVAVAMAVGARSALKTDIGFGVTGYLSESEGYLVPVGTVCMGFADKDRVITKTFKFHYDRDRNKEQAVNTALLQIWKFIKREMQ